MDSGHWGVLEVVRPTYSLPQSLAQGAVRIEKEVSCGNPREMDEKLEFIMLGAHGPSLCFLPVDIMLLILMGFRYFSDGVLSMCCLCDCP